MLSTDSEGLYECSSTLESGCCFIGCACGVDLCSMVETMYAVCIYIPSVTAGILYVLPSFTHAYHTSNIVLGETML